MDSQNAKRLLITLPADMVRIIREKVAGGAYGSTSEVIRDALHDWLERERRLAALDTTIANGIADAKAGRLQPINAVRSDPQIRIGKKSRPPG